jgi:hypothetical protein
MSCLVMSQVAHNTILDETFQHIYTHNCLASSRYKSKNFFIRMQGSYHPCIIWSSSFTQVDMTKREPIASNASPPFFPKSKVLFQHIDDVLVDSNIHILSFIFCTTHMHTIVVSFYVVLMAMWLWCSKVSNTGWLLFEINYHGSDYYPINTFIIFIG